MNNNIYKQGEIFRLCSKLLFKVSHKSISKKVKDLFKVHANDTKTTYIMWGKLFTMSFHCELFLRYSSLFNGNLSLLKFWTRQKVLRHCNWQLNDHMNIMYLACISPLELHLNSSKGTKCSFSFFAFPNILASENQLFIDRFKNMVSSKFLPPSPSIYARPPTS